MRRPPMNPYNPDLTGKTYIVTGSNEGIGFEISKQLSKLNANTILACWNPVKGEKAERILKMVTSNPNVQYIHLDFADPKSVSKFVEEIKKKGIKIDGLVNNACAHYKGLSLTDNGIERTMATNYFGPFQLTVLLINDNILSENCRIVNLSSELYKGGKVDEKSIKKIENFNGTLFYANSKLALNLFTYELQSKLNQDKKGIISCTVTPGTCTETWKDTNYIIKKMFEFFPFIFNSNWEGAQTALYCLFAPDIVGGEFYENNKLVGFKSNLNDENKRKMIWEETEKICHVKYLPNRTD